VAKLILELDAPAFPAVLDAAGPIFDGVLDDLTIQIHEPIATGQMDMTDVTRPRTLGEKRDFWIFGSYPFDRNARTLEVGSSSRIKVGAFLRASYPELSPRVREALHWYTKSLRMSFDHDQFMLLWIAFETLLDDSGFAVTGVYVANCGHEIAQCPTCQRETSRIVRGATARQYLEQVGVAGDEAARLGDSDK
jgi:hypothetical protein